MNHLKKYRVILAFSRLSDFILPFLNSNRINLLKLPDTREHWKPFLRKLNYNSITKFVLDVTTENLDFFLKIVI